MWVEPGLVAFTQEKFNPGKTNPGSHWVSFCSVNRALDSGISRFHRCISKQFRAIARAHTRAHVVSAQAYAL